MKPRILVADDDPDMRRLIQFVLERDAYQVIEASDGQEAMTQALDGSPTVILLDVRMPFIDGFEVCRRLRAETRTRRVPIIILSAVSDPESQVQGLQLGAVDYLTKPVNLKLLSDRVRFAVQRHNIGRMFDPAP